MQADSDNHALIQEMEGLPRVGFPSICKDIWKNIWGGRYQPSTVGSFRDYLVCRELSDPNPCPFLVWPGNIVIERLINLVV